MSSIREYNLGETRMGNTRVSTTLKSTDEGYTHNHKQDPSAPQKVHTALTGAAVSDPERVKARPGFIWARVVAMTPAAETTLVLPENIRPMMRHRCVTVDGTVILFEQGTGKLVRFGGVGQEEEWICLPKSKIMAHMDGPWMTVTGGYVFVTPEEIPQESETIITLAPKHVRERGWAVGRVMSNPSDYGSSFLLEGDRIIYSTAHLTEVVVRDRILHAVHSNHVWGVIE